MTQLLSKDLSPEFPRKIRKFLYFYHTIKQPFLQGIHYNKRITNIFPFFVTLIQVFPELLFCSRYGKIPVSQSKGGGPCFPSQF